MFTWIILAVIIIIIVLINIFSTPKTYQNYDISSRSRCPECGQLFDLDEAEEVWGENEAYNIYGQDIYEYYCPKCNTLIDECDIDEVFDDDDDY